MTLLKSPLFYVGDKHKILEQILIYFPNKIERFIEPFTGGGSVFLNIKATEYLLNDIDSYLIKLHNFLIQESYNSESFFIKLDKILVDYNLSRSYREDIVPEALKKESKKTYYARFNKAGYLALRNNFNQTRSLLELYVLLIYGFNRFLRFNLNDKFNLPVGNIDLNQKVINCLNSYFNFVSHNKIKTTNQDFREFLLDIEFKKNDFIYFDPPYLISSSEYNKLWNLTHEKDLLCKLDVLSKKNIKWAISNVTEHKGRINALFSNWMQQYNVYQITSNYISYHDNTKKKTKEVLVTNYEK